MSSRLFALASVVALSFSAVACAATTDAASNDEDAAAADESAVTAKKACSKADYDKGLASYKAAVSHAKARAAGNVCDDGTMIADIANDLGNAVATCGEFKKVIATSPWAAPARSALAGNLALPALDGRLDARTLAGLGDAIVGVTLFGPAPGVYGNMSKIAFAAGGKATVSTLDVANDGTPHWKDAPATYRIDGARITITSGGRSTSYTLKAEPGQAPYKNLPSFVLEPASGDVFRSLPSECEA